MRSAAQSLGLISFRIQMIHGNQNQSFFHVLDMLIAAPMDPTLTTTFESIRDFWSFQIVLSTLEIPMPVIFHE